MLFILNISNSELCKLERNLITLSEILSNKKQNFLSRDINRKIDQEECKL